MAQNNSKRTTTIERLKHRYGLREKSGVVIACFVVVIILAIASYFLTGNGCGVEISRGSSETNIQDKAKVETEINSNQGSSNHESTSKKSESEEDQTTVIVDVDGAVAAPGVYEIGGSDPRVRDAVAMAGGLAEDADTSQINLASALSDGEKVYIPHQGETVAAPLASATGSSSSVSGTAATGGQSAGENSSANGLININTATVGELETLPGIGEVTAQTIIKDRETNGLFASTEDLMRVSGIGEKKYEKVKGMICV